MCGVKKMVEPAYTKKFTRLTKPILTHPFGHIWFLILIVASRYAFPWWREKEIVSDERRLQGLCPLTPEEATLILQALGFDQNTQIYIASGEIYGSEKRLAALRATYPRIVSDCP